MKGWNNEKIKEQLQLHKKQNKDDRYNYLNKEFNSLYYCWELEKYTIKLKKQLEEYKNMRKGIISFIENNTYEYKNDKGLKDKALSINVTRFTNLLLNILNKVGGSDE